MSKYSRDTVEIVVKHLAKSKCSDKLDVNYLSEVLRAYFALGRPSYFSQYKKQLLDVYVKILPHLTVEQCFQIAHDLFLYVRTNNSTNSDLENQSEINRLVLQPFKSNLKLILPSLNVSNLNFSLNEDTYLILTRHAVTQGMYAPGKHIYAVCDALLKAKKKVVLVNFGNEDEKFFELREYSYFSFYKCESHYNSLQSFFALRELINEIRPTEIITEIELSVINLIEAIGVSSDVCLLSSGFFQTPWFNKKYLGSELYSDDMQMRDELVEIPQTHSLEILAPSLAQTQIDQMRTSLGIQQNFVLGSFARYEMFTTQFLLFAKRALDLVPNSVLVLAGANDQQIVQTYLAEEIAQKKVILFGPVKTHVLGWAVDVFLDPFPTVAGFAALESLAKGKPVVTKECPGLGNYKKSRVQDLIFKRESDLIEALISMSECKNEYFKWSQQSKHLAAGFDNSTALAAAIYNSPRQRHLSFQNA